MTKSMATIGQKQSRKKSKESAMKAREWTEIQKAMKAGNHRAIGSGSDSMKISNGKHKYSLCAALVIGLEIAAIESLQ